MSHPDNEILMAQVKAIVSGRHAEMLRQLLYILSNPQGHCQGNAENGPLKVVREILLIVYQDTRASVARGGGCQYAATCAAAPELGCEPGKTSKAKLVKITKGMSIANGRRLKIV